MAGLVAPAVYHLVDRNGDLWPAVQSAPDMIPAGEAELRPSNGHLPILFLPLLEFAWVSGSDVHEFDPAAVKSISNGPENDQLKDAFACILGSDEPRRPAYPDLGFWRSEIMARDLQDIMTSDDSDTGHARAALRTKKPMPSPHKDAKRPWQKFKMEKEFGEEFGHAKRVKFNTDMGKHTNHWFPDENDDDARPPAGYFERLKREKQEEDMERASILIDMTEDEDSDSDADTDVTVDGSPAYSSRELLPVPIPRAHPPTERVGVRCAVEEVSKNSDRPLLSPKNRPTANTFPTNRPDQTDDQSAIVELCRELDTARTESDRNLGEKAVSQLIDSAPWSDGSTVLIAKVAFRAKPRPDLDRDFEHHLREAAAEHMSWSYERLRESHNSTMAMLMRDHEDLAEMVYERRLKILREKRAEVVEIIDSDSDGD